MGAFEKGTKGKQSHLQRLVAVLWYLGRVNMKVDGGESGGRVPRILLYLILALAFWMVGVFVRSAVRDVVFTGVNTDVGMLFWVLTTVVAAFFLVASASEVVVLNYGLTDRFVGTLGIKEGNVPRRVGVELVYVLLVLLLVLTTVPILVNIEGYGYLLSMVATYVGLGFIILLIYDMGRNFIMILQKKIQYSIPGKAARLK